jgi:uncharacterized protein YjbI with pentapeptide repeats
VEFAGCELGSLRWTGGKISRTRFGNCQLAGARFEDVSMDHVIFTDCKMDYAMLSRIRASGPVMFTGCSLREAEFTGCDLAGSLLSQCDLRRARFGQGRYTRCDLRDNDLSTVTGTHFLKHVVLDRAQLLQLAQALATELNVTYGDSPDDPVLPCIHPGGHIAGETATMAWLLAGHYQRTRHPCRLGSRGHHRSRAS